MELKIYSFDQIRLSESDLKVKGNGTLKNKAVADEQTEERNRLRKFRRCDFNPVGYAETQSDETTKVPGRNISRLKKPKPSYPKIDLVDLLFNQSIFDYCISDESLDEEVFTQTSTIKILKKNQKKQVMKSKSYTKISNDKSKTEKKSTLIHKNYTDETDVSETDSDTSYIPIKKPTSKPKEKNLPKKKNFQTQMKENSKPISKKRKVSKASNSDKEQETDQESLDSGYVSNPTKKTKVTEVEKKKGKYSCFLLILSIRCYDIA